MSEMFGVDKFNIVQDEDYYYFFRSLEPGDNKDIENGIGIKDGKISQLRTDRERYEENPNNPSPKYNENSEISLQEICDHIKIHYRKDTNCISFSSNANVALSYGRDWFTDRYVAIKVPKSEIGKTVFNAGEYLLDEISKAIIEKEKELDKKDSKILDLLRKIDECNSKDEVVDIVTSIYKLSDSKKSYTGKKLGEKVSVTSRFSKYRALSEEQNIEKDKIFAKLTILEYYGKIRGLIPHTAQNSKLLETVGSAFSSSEIIQYGDTKDLDIIEISPKIMDMLSLLQQANEQFEKENSDKSFIEEKKNKIHEIQMKLIEISMQGYSIENKNGKLVLVNNEQEIDIGLDENSSLLNIEDSYQELDIDEMYELTRWKSKF